MIILPSISVISVFTIWEIEGRWVSNSPMIFIWVTLVQKLGPKIYHREQSNHKVGPNGSLLSEMLSSETFSLEITVLGLVIELVIDISFFILLGTN
jgi:hypothetical protein